MILYKYRFIIYTIVALAFLFAVALVTTFFSDSETSYDFEKRATRLNGIFATDQGKVYAMVPSNGYYEVKDANAETFKVLSDDLKDAHIGYDDRHVYAGNIIVEGVDPAGIRPLGNNYYTNDVTSFYCNRNSQRNERLGALTEVIQLVGNNWGLTHKPQIYWYPFVQLPGDGGAYKSVLTYGITVNNKQVFYKGLPLPGADPKNIQSISINRDGQRDCESIDYFTDGKRVYFQNELLSLSYNPSLYEPRIEGDIPSRNAYLIDEENGMVYADGFAFDKDKAPYRLLSAQLKHANQVLFASKEGIYFYDAEDKKMRRANPNPFVQNQFEEIAPDVFKSGNKIYYLRAVENRGHKSGLQSRNTHLMELEAVSASGLRHIGKKENRYSNVWQYRNRYFYFDDLGDSQLMSSAVYEVKDAATAQQIAESENLRSDDIRELNLSGKLIQPVSDKILTSSTGYKNKDRLLLYWIVGSCIGIVLLLMFLLRNKKIPPFVIKDDWLIINNLSFKRYRIEEIEKVVFRMVKTKSLATGFSGRMQVARRNGRVGRSYLFASKISLVPEKEETLRLYIEELQTQLNVYGIKSELARR